MIIKRTNCSAGTNRSSQGGHIVQLVETTRHPLDLQIGTAIQQPAKVNQLIYSQEFSFVRHV